MTRFMDIDPLELDQLNIKHALRIAKFGFSPTLFGEKPNVEINIQSGMKEWRIPLENAVSKADQEFRMKDSIEDIWKKFSSPLKYFIRSRISNDFIAGDILQEVYVKICSHIEDLEDEKKS